MADLLNKKAPETDNPDTQGTEKKEKKKKEKPAKKQYLDHNNMNFLERYETVVEGKKTEINIDAYKKPITIGAVILLAALVLVQALSIVTKAQVKSLNKYINDESNIASYNEAIELKSKIDDANLQKTNLETMIAAIDSYPDVDRNFFTQVNTAATGNAVGINTYGYSGKNGFLSLECTAATPQNISDFIRALDATKLFSIVEYDGFTGGAEGGYTFSVSCYCTAVSK